MADVPKLDALQREVLAALLPGIDDVDLRYDLAAWIDRSQQRSPVVGLPGEPVDVHAEGAHAVRCIGLPTLPCS